MTTNAPETTAKHEKVLHTQKKKKSKIQQYDEDSKERLEYKKTYENCLEKTNKNKRNT